MMKILWNYQSNNECPLCSTGVFPTEEGAHKCIKCGIPVHALPSCSWQKSDDETLRICKSCLETKNSYLNDETTAHETWNRKSKRQKQKSYLTPNPFLRHVNINNSRITVILPILKNGSRAEELKSCNIKDIGIYSVIHVLLTRWRSYLWYHTVIVNIIKTVSMDLILYILFLNLFQILLKMA